MNYLWGSMILVGIIYGIVTGNVDAVSEAVLSSSKEAVTLCITMLGVMALWMGIMKIAEDAGLIQSISRLIQPFIRFLFPGIPEGHEAEQHITTNFIANFLGLGWAATPAGLKAMESLAKLEEERRAAESAGLKESGNLKRSAEEEWAAEPAGQDRWAGATRKTDVRSGKTNGRSAGQWLKKANRQTTGRNAAGSRIPARPRGTASNEMCTFLILNISSLQLIPVNVIAYRAQYGSVNPTAIVGPAIAATAVSTAVAVVFCKVMDGKRKM